MPRRRPSNAYDIPNTSVQFTGYLVDKVTEDSIESDLCCKRTKMFFKNHWNGLFAVIVPSVLAVALLIPWEGERDKETESCWQCVFVVLVILYFWLTEPIPIPITSLMPIILLPIFELLDPEVISSLYFTNAAIMVICGAMVALTIEYCGMNNQVALLLVRMCGYRLRLLHFVTMLMSFFLSMFCQGIIVTVFLCPVIFAILKILGKYFKLIEIYAETKQTYDDPVRSPSKVAVGFYLGICYSVAIGGTGSLLGSKTNVEIQNAYNQEVNINTIDNHTITFKNFTAFCILPGLIMFFITYFILEFRYFGMFRPHKNPKYFGILERKRTINFKPLYEKYGAVRCEEITVIILLVLLIMACDLRIMGVQWVQYFDNDKLPLNSMPIVFGVVLLFAIPRDLSFLRYWFKGNYQLPRHEIPSLGKWSFMVYKLPWENFLIMGCASVISRAMEESKVYAKVKVLFEIFRNLPRELSIFAFVTLQFLLTQLTEASTVVELFMTLLKTSQGLMDFHPIYFVMPVAFIANISLMLPVQTPSNLIVSGYSHMKVSDFFITGFFVTVASYFVMLIIVMYWTQVIFPNLPEHEIFLKNATGLDD